MRWQHIKDWPAGSWVTIIVLIFVGGRYLWIEMGRPAHEREITAAYGAVGLFDGTPQADGTGKRVTFVETGDKGYAVFLADASTGRKTVVEQEDASGPFGDDRDLHVWPWSPDDRAFAYSVAEQIKIGDPQTGEIMAGMVASTNVTSLAWLTPMAFVCQDADEKLELFEREKGGVWNRKELAAHSTDGFALRSVSGMGAASFEDAGNGNGVGKAFDQNVNTDWSAEMVGGPVWLQYQFNGAAWAITRYTLISSAQDATANPRDWELLGSSDGNHWTILDSRTNETFTSRQESKQYVFANQTPYRFYRLKVTATAEGWRSGVRLAEFQLGSENTPEAATASAENAPTEGVAKAFENSADAKWYNTGVAPPGWLQYQFGGGAAWAVSQYTLTSANDMPERDPKDWQFLASDDGSNWTMLDARNGEAFSARRQTKSYSLFNTMPYRFYRLNITTNIGGSAYGLQLSGFTLKATNALGELSNVSFPHDPFLNAFSLTALSSNTIAWGQSNCLWSMNLTSNVPQLLLDLRTGLPANTTLSGFSYSKNTGQFLLNCIQDGNDSAWSFNPPSELTQIKTTDPVENAVWLNNDGWVGRQNGHLLAGTNAAAKPTQFLANANINSFTISADGQKIFLLGTVNDEIAAGIWQYDLASNQLRSIVSPTDHPSRYVKRLDPINNHILSADGKYTLYLPPDFYRHPHRKHPLIIGDTDFGVAVNGAHGRLWIPAMVDCGACVVIVNRGGWWDNLDKWGAEVTTAYQQLSPYLNIDKNRVYLFGASAETTYISQYLTNSPIQCRGVILLNPTGLPDPSSLPRWQAKPKILLSAGGREGEDERFKRYQQDALASGVMVECFISPGEGHHFIGNAGQLQRAKAITHFVFDE